MDRTGNVLFAAMFSLTEGLHVHKTAGIWELAHILTRAEFKNACSFTSISLFLFKMSSLIRHNHKFTSFHVCVALRTDRGRDCLVLGLQTAISEIRLDSLDTHTFCPKWTRNPRSQYSDRRTTTVVGLGSVTQLSETEPSGPFKRWLPPDCATIAGD